MNDTTGPMDIIGTMLVFLLLLCGGAVIYEYISTSPEERAAATQSKYVLNIGMSSFYVNSFTNSNGSLSFHDVLRDENFTFVGKSYSVHDNDHQ